MSAKKRLGRGLDSLIPTDIEELSDIANSNQLDTDSVHQIDISKISTNPYQPRSEFEDSSLSELKESIEQHGVIQPIVLSKNGSRFQLIAGERRLRAARAAGLKKIPSIIRSSSEQQQLEVAIVENVQRSDLTPLELANAYSKLNTQFNLSYEQIGKKVGKAKTTVINIVRLLDLVYEAKKALSENRITLAHAKALVSTKNPQKQLAMLDVILKNKLNSAKAEELARRLKKQDLPAKKAMGLHSYNQAMEDKLADKLSTKVHLRRTSRGGRIIIQFYGDEELARIVDEIIN